MSFYFVVFQCDLVEKLTEANMASDVTLLHDVGAFNVINATKYYARERATSTTPCSTSIAIHSAAIYARKHSRVTSTSACISEQLISTTLMASNAIGARMPERLDDSYGVISSFTRSHANAVFAGKASAEIPT